MFNNFLSSTLTATAVLIISGFVSTGVASANVLVNGDFSQVGPVGSPTCVTGPAAGWSAAAAWYQQAVVSGSHACTVLGTAGNLSDINVQSNGVASSATPLGNGIY